MKVVCVQFYLASTEVLEDAPSLAGIGCFAQM